MQDIEDKQDLIKDFQKRGKESNDREQKLKALNEESKE